MVRRNLAALLIAAAAAMTIARAEEPAHYTFDPKPPGTIVQSRVVYLAGEAMHAQWRAVISKVPLGEGASQTFDQWFLSIYAIDGATYDLKYRSPGDGVPLSRVEKANGAQLWFPVQSASIVGAAELMGAGAQQLVVQSHEASADCGSSRVDVFFYDAAMRMIMPTLSVENGCDLSASIVHEASGDALAVTGPYYGPNAALCCPTKNRATAIFRFHDGTWTQAPRYFRVLRNP